MRLEQIQELAPLQIIEEEEEVDAMEDRLEGQSPWEIAFEEGEKAATEEVLDDWEEDDEW